MRGGANRQLNAALQGGPPPPAAALPRAGSASPPQALVPRTGESPTTYGSAEVQAMIASALAQQREAAPPVAPVLDVAALAAQLAPLLPTNPPRGGRGGPPRRAVLVDELRGVFNPEKMADETRRLMLSQGMKYAPTAADLSAILLASALSDDTSELHLSSYHQTARAKVKKASENFRRSVNDALRRMLPALWAALRAAPGYDALTPPSFPGANDPGIRAAILASVYDAMSGRALRASGNIDPAHSNLSACISPIAYTSLANQASELWNGRVASRERDAVVGNGEVHWQNVAGQAAAAARRQQDENGDGEPVYRAGKVRRVTPGAFLTPQPLALMNGGGDDDDDDERTQAP